MEEAYLQDPPFCVKIELVEGCSLSCEFCGINGIREKAGGYKFMTDEMVELVAERLGTAINEHGWNPRLEFDMHGEPSLHPKLISSIATLRGAVGDKISMVMFSNGSGFAKDPLVMHTLLEAGLNTIGLDAYEHVNIVPRLLEKYDTLTVGYGPNRIPIYHYPQQKEHNLHTGRRVGHKDIVVIQDITVAVTGNHSELNTHCGGGMKPGPVLNARCAKPFRELSIRWDGNVALCCNDFRGIYKVANVSDYSLHDLWNHETFHAARKKLYHADRNFAPCASCNAKSMRVGLLPDQKGHYMLPEADEHDEQLIADAVAGQSYTPIVLRGWETPDGVHPINWYDAKKAEPKP